MDIEPVIDEGLGNSSYVLGLGDGSAAVIDPFRDPAPYLRIAERRGWRIRFAIETHLHADFVSGSRELAALGAEVVASAGAPVAFPARLLDDGDELDLGGLKVRALATPGHTPEHLSYLVLDGGAPVGLFSGGALIPGGVARPDLLGPEHTEALARAAYRSLHERVLTLPGELAVYPTHGPGSFCSTGEGSGRTTTIAAEHAANPLLAADDEDTFVRRLLGGLGSYPPYFLELRAVNQAGPAVIGVEPPPPAPLDPAAVERAVGDGAQLIDVRDIEAFGAGHVPGSLSIALRPAFATWLGWLVERDRPLVFVGDDRTDRAALVRAALSIGYERLAGELAGGVEAWRAAGRPVTAVPLRTAGEVDPARDVVDVRQASEWRDEHVAGAWHAELGELAKRVPELPGGPIVVHCAHGERAMTGASVLLRGGHADVVALHDGGPRALAEGTGRRLERGA